MDFEDWWSDLEARYKKNKPIKSYLHLDPFVYPNKKTKDKLEKKIIRNKLKGHSFYPLLKTVLKHKTHKRVEPAIPNKKKFTVKIKKRPISYCSHFDSLIISYYNHCLSEAYEDFLEDYNFSKSVLAYRKFTDKRSNVDFAIEAFEEIKARKNCIVLTFDVTSFFDELNHGILKENLCSVLKVSRLEEDWFKVFKYCTRYSYVYKDDLVNRFGSDWVPKNGQICSPREYREIRSKSNIVKKNVIDTDPSNQKGVPQGTPISATLSNVFMITFDRKLAEYCAQMNIKYLRYSDDILIVCQESQEHLVRTKLVDLLKDHHLHSNEKKETYRKFIEDQSGVLSCLNEEGNHSTQQYLGLEFNGVQSRIRSSSISRSRWKMRNGIKRALYRAMGNGNTHPFLIKKGLVRRYTSNSKNNFYSYTHRVDKTFEESATDPSFVSKRLRRRSKRVLNNAITQVGNKFHRSRKINWMISKGIFKTKVKY